MKKITNGIFIPNDKLQNLSYLQGKSLEELGKQCYLEDNISVETPLPKEIASKLKHIASDNGISRRELLRNIIYKWLEDYDYSHESIQ